MSKAMDASEFIALAAGRSTTAYVADVVLSFDPLATIDITGTGYLVTPMTLLETNHTFLDRTSGAEDLPLYIDSMCDEAGLCNQNNNDFKYYFNSGRVLLIGRRPCVAGEWIQVVFTLPIEDGLVYGYDGDAIPWDDAVNLLEKTLTGEFEPLPACATTTPGDPAKPPDDGGTATSSSGPPDASP